MNKAERWFDGVCKVIRAINAYRTNKYEQETAVIAARLRMQLRHYQENLRAVNKTGDQREHLVRGIVDGAQTLRAYEQGLRRPMIAFNRSVNGYCAFFCDPAQPEELEVFDFIVSELPSACRKPALWRALNQTMARRAQEVYRELMAGGHFKVLGLGLDNGKLVFVNVNYLPEQNQWAVYLLPVAEEDLPDLPEATTA